MRLFNQENISGLRCSTCKIIRWGYIFEQNIWEFILMWMFLSVSMNIENNLVSIIFIRDGDMGHESMIK